MKKKKNNKLPPFVAMTWDILNSWAYKDLSPSACKAVPYFFGKIKLGFNDPQRYLSNFTFSYPEGKKLGFAPATFSKIIQNLIKFGFIDPIDKGGLKGYGKGYNIFRLSDRWEAYGTNQFKTCEWKCFKPQNNTKVTSKRETYNFKKGNKRALKSESISHSEAVEEIL